jgi:lipopolysaccharide/colanic/teichoic acid biosynthesis glycosyltransferase
MLRPTTRHDGCAQYGRAQNERAQYGRARYAWIGAAVKRLFDVGLCLASLPLTVPLGTAIAAVVKLTSPGPVLYQARRIGRYGRPIQVLKFRTMRVDRAGPSVTRSGDARITPAGRLLRASKLDELPQIINVLGGDMSIVGPRPEDPKYVAAYTDEQRQVLSVRPGITSLAFLRFGHEQELIERARPADAESFYVTEILPEKLEIELRYVRDWSVRGDLQILGRTFVGLLS